MDEIQVVAVAGGICVQCGNGLWGGPPCEHKIDVALEQSAPQPEEEKMTVEQREAMAGAAKREAAALTALRPGDNNNPPPCPRCEVDHPWRECDGGR